MKKEKRRFLAENYSLAMNARGYKLPFIIVNRLKNLEELKGKEFISAIKRAGISDGLKKLENIEAKPTGGDVDLLPGDVLYVAQNSGVSLTGENFPEGNRLTYFKIECIPTTFWGRLKMIWKTFIK